jgi:hypothetical protein
MSNINVQLPQTASEFQSALKAGIECATKSPYNNQNKLNDCTAVALGLSNFNALKPQLESLEPISAIYDGQHQIVNGKVIKEEVYQNEISQFYIVPLEDEIYWIEQYIKDGTLFGQDKVLAMNDLKILYSWNDEYIMKSHSTNLYLSPTKDTFKWNEQCNIMLKASGFKEFKLKITQPKQNINTLAELITQSAVLIKKHNSFVSSSYIEKDILVICWFDSNGDDFYFELDLLNDTFVRNGNGGFTLKSKEYSDLDITLLSPMNI